MALLGKHLRHVATILYNSLLYSLSHLALIQVRQYKFYIYGYVYMYICKILLFLFYLHFSTFFTSSLAKIAKEFAQLLNNLTNPWDFCTFSFLNTQTQAHARTPTHIYTFTCYCILSFHFSFLNKTNAQLSHRHLVLAVSQSVSQSVSFELTALIRPQVAIYSNLCNLLASSNSIWHLHFLLLT